jgi:predicted helicase
VARVDYLLRTQLHLPDGLADPNVVVLDPCCGTGAYLVEVLRQIGEKLKAQGSDALTAHQLKQAVTHRLFGFELLPAPYVVAHLQMGLALRKLGAPLQGQERASVYLTNSLTGWEPPPPGSPKEQIEQFPEIAQEKEAAEQVKRGQAILVILGNPPYNGYAGASMAEERDLTNAYRVAKTGPQPQGQGLNDLYVRFFRMAERQIVERTGRGIISYVSNYSWVDGLSHTAMRERFLQAFDQVWIDNLHGDKYRTGKLTPEGLPDPSAFSTQYNREGIQVGTAIATLVRRMPDTAAPKVASVKTRSFWGKEKLVELMQCMSSKGPAWQTVTPQVQLGRVFNLMQTTTNYFDWPRLPELFPVSYPGIKTSRDAALTSIDRVNLEERMLRYFDANLTDADIAADSPSLMQKSNRFDAANERKEAIHRGINKGCIVRYCYRPMDTRWLYWYPEGKLLDEKRPDYFPQVFNGNLWLFTTGQTRKDLAEPAFATSLVTDLNMQDSGSRGTPLQILDDIYGANPQDSARYNLSHGSTKYLQLLEVNAESLFFHSLAVTYSHMYRTENSGGLAQDWPRIPLPATREALLASAALGREVAALLDTETAVPGVTSGTVRDELKTIAVVSNVGGGMLTPAEFALTAGWGSGGQGSATMPGKGKTEPRVCTPDEQSDGFGTTATLDVYLNATAYWKNIPQPVYDFTIGGYQVIKKWLSYRDQRVLGRALSMEEILEVRAMARRLAALVLLQPKLDENYRTVAAATWAFSRET